MKFTLEEFRLHIGIRKESLIKWNKKLRNVLVEEYNSLHCKKVGSINFTVEIDEAHLYSNRRIIGKKLVGLI